jgi:hypothetical protein
MTNRECFEFVETQAPEAVRHLTAKIRTGLSAKAISDCLDKNIPLEFRQVISGAIFHAQAMANEA